MKIAVDAQCMQGARTGIGHASLTLVREMQKQAPDIEWLLYAKNARYDMSTPARICWESLWIPLCSMRDKPDVIFSPGFSPAWTAPAPRVATVHDLIGMSFSGNQARVSSLYWSRWLPAMLKRADKLVAISEATRKEITRLLHIPPSKIDIVPDAADPRYVKLAHSSPIEKALAMREIDRPYLLSIGTAEPRKNLLRMIEAFAILPDELRRKHLLVIAGKQGPAAAALQRLIQERGLTRQVKWLGYVPDDELVYLYNGCLGYVFLSLAEGFGLPPLEAMSCGKSGVASNASSIPEVVGDSALQVDPLDVQAASAAMRQYLEDAGLRSELEHKAYERSKLFSAERSAERMLTILRKAAH